MHAYESGQGWALSAHLGQLKQDKMGRDCCEVICGAPTALRSYGID